MSFVEQSNNSPPLNNVSSQERAINKGNLKGRTVTNKPLIPGSWKIAFFIGVLITVGILITTVLATRGILHLPEIWQFNLIAGIGGSMGLLQLSTLIGAGIASIHYSRSEKKQQEAEESSLEKEQNADGSSILVDDLIDPVEEVEQPILHSRHIDDSVDAATWKERLKTPRPMDQGWAQYNLVDPSQPLAQESNGFLQLPVFGKYEKGKNSYANNSISMGVKLPKQQLKAFPEKLQNWFQHEQEQNKKEIECYFLVFDNSDAKISGSKRNLALHTMALPEYDPKNPNSPKGKAKGIMSTSNGIKTQMQIGMFEPRGIEPGKDSTKCIPNIDKTGKLREHTLELHKDSKSPLPMFSPDVATLDVDREKHAVSSAYFGATFRNKAVAIHAVILNSVNDDESTEEGQKGTEGTQLYNAMKKGTPQEFLDELKKSNFADLANIQKTFTHPTDL